MAQLSLFPESHTPQPPETVDTAAIAGHIAANAPDQPYEAQLQRARDLEELRGESNPYVSLPDEVKPDNQESDWPLPEETKVIGKVGVAGAREALNQTRKS